MKTSYFVTPRTMDEATFIPSGNAIEHHSAGYSQRFMATLYIVAAVAFAVIWWTA